MANRIIRYYQKPEGVYHSSVFYQLSGSVGPSSIVCDKKGNIYVGQYDILGLFVLYLHYLFIFNFCVYDV